MLLEHFYARYDPQENQNRNDEFEALLAETGQDFASRTAFCRALMRKYGDTPLLREEQHRSEGEHLNAGAFDETFLEMIEAKREGFNMDDCIEHFEVVCPPGVLGLELEEHEFSHYYTTDTSNKDETDVRSLGAVTIGRMQMKALKGGISSGTRKRQPTLSALARMRGRTNQDAENLQIGNFDEGKLSKLGGNMKMFPSLSTLDKAARMYKNAHNNKRSAQSGMHVDDITPRCYVAKVGSSNSDSSIGMDINPLLGRIPIGSLLVAVNGESVVQKNKTEISNLISRLQDKVRVLTFKLHFLEQLNTHSAKVK
jgi:hypothetical protein